MDRRTKICEFLLGMAILAMLLSVIMAPGDQPEPQTGGVPVETEQP